MADKSKLACARMALSFVKQGMSVGLGTGSTAEIFIDLLGKKNMEDDLDLTCVATSRASDGQARKLGLKVVEFPKIDSLDAAFDGADQVDPKLNLIKGLGGALVREKIVDYRARRFYVMVGENKLVKALSGIVPVETIPMSEEHVRRELVGMGAASAQTRMDGAEKFVSDNGNLILHAAFQKIPDPEWLDAQITRLPGVLESGIFTSRNVTAVVGKPDGTGRLLE
ncbi:MAG: ribose-5-phosphate isomerase RpiA [Candidatus Micrarchaeia archaeon]|jgi:ribose 5-phosphate isomerase A